MTRIFIMHMIMDHDTDLYHAHEMDHDMNLYHAHDMDHDMNLYHAHENGS